MNESDRLELVAGHRRCTKCHIAKPLDQFHKQGRGKLHPQCKVCRNQGFIAQRAAMAAGTPRQVAREERIFLAKNGKRRCGRCGEVQPHGNFASYGERTRRDGTAVKVLSSACMTCQGTDMDSVYRRRELRVQAAEGMRTCKGCKKVLPVTDFYKRSGGGGYQSYCKPCYNGRTESE